MAPPTTINVADAYDGCTVFITGATGYLGGLCMENILRNCPGVKKIYIAIREKKGQPPVERLQKLLADATYVKLRPQMSSIMQKLEVLPVDLGKKQCGISELKQKELAEEVNYVIHCASAIRFDLPISEVMSQNYGPTKELLELALKWKNLKGWCYMSTAFVNLNLPQNAQIEEKIYDLTDVTNKEAKGAVIDGLELAEKWMSMPPEEAQKHAWKFIVKNKFVNTYTISKNLTERLVMSYAAKGLNVCITRPTLVTSVAGDPCPGYIGNSSGITGAILGAAYGILTHSSHSASSIVPVVPGDLVSQGTVVAAAAVAAGAEQKIYHICTSHTFPVRNKEFYGVMLDFVQLDPPKLKTLRAKNAEWKIKHMTTKRECVAHNIKQGTKIQLASMFLKWKGDKKMAEKLRMGWAAWKDLNKPWKDMNYTFYTNGTKQLQSMLTGEETKTFKCIWSKNLGDQWDQYLRTYTSGVAHLYLRVTPKEEFYHLHNYRPAGDRVKA